MTGNIFLKNKRVLRGFSFEGKLQLQKVPSDRSFGGRGIQQAAREAKGDLSAGEVIVEAIHIEMRVEARSPGESYLGKKSEGRIKQRSYVTEGNGGKRTKAVSQMLRKETVSREIVRPNAGGRK